MTPIARAAKATRAAIEALMPLLSITRLRVRAWRFPPGFLWYALRSARQAQRSPGYLGGKTYNDSRRTFWTATLWQEEASLRAFLRAEPHRSAMRRLAHWCDEASVAHWPTDAATLPDLPQVHRWMIERGRPSRVNHPSREHSEMRVAAPSAFGERKWPRAAERTEEKENAKARRPAARRRRAAACRARAPLRAWGCRSA